MFLQVRQHNFFSFFPDLLTFSLIDCSAVPWYFSVALQIKGYLTLRCSLKLAPRIHRIQASFCPLLSLEKGEYIGLSSNRSLTFTFNFGGCIGLLKTATHLFVSAFPVVWNYSCWEWRLECLLLRSNETETHVCKQATGEIVLLLTSETFLCMYWKLDSRVVRIGNATGSQVSSNVRCVEPWRELVGLVWFLRCCYCMEKSKDKLMRFVYNPL